MRDTSRGSLTGHQTSTEQEQQRLDSTLASSKRSLRPDPPRPVPRGVNEQDLQRKAPSQRDSKQSSRSSQSKKRLRTLSFQAVEALAKAGAAPENDA